MKPHLLLSVAAIACVITACSKDKTYGDASTSAGSTEQTASGTPAGADAAAADRGTTETAAPAHSPTEPGSTVEPSPTAEDMSAQGFVERAATVELFDIQSSQVVVEKPGVDQDVKDFANEMVGAHSVSLDQLKAIASAEGLDVPQALDADHQRLLDELKAASGKKLMRLFLDQQTRAHESELSLFQSFSANGEDQKLKKFAQGLAPKTQDHLDMVTSLNSRKAF